MPKTSLHGAPSKRSGVRHEFYDAWRFQAEGFLDVPTILARRWPQLVMRNQAMLFQVAYDLQLLLQFNYERAGT
jgi:hypothetical protein